MEFEPAGGALTGRLLRAHQPMRSLFGRGGKWEAHGRRLVPNRALPAPIQHVLYAASDYRTPISAFRSHDRDHGRLSENRLPPLWAMIECGGKGASRPFRAVFAVLTGWDASGG